MEIVNLIEHPNWDMQSLRVHHQFLDLACVREYVGGTEDLRPYYKVQKAAAERTHSEWLIPGTVSTTVTVNQNWRCACHEDDGNLQNGFSAFTCMASNLTGGELIWPRWGVAIQLGFGDV